MGTRSTIAFIERSSRGNKTYDEELVRIYQQYDGYPDGVGKKLATWLDGHRLVNGFGLDMTAENGYCNGVGCMSAQFIHDFKVNIGGFYITTKDDEEEYNYRVIVEDDYIILEMYDYQGRKMFSGTPLRFLGAVDNGEFDD